MDSAPIEELITGDQFSLSSAQREVVLLPLLEEMVRHHSVSNKLYRRIIESKGLPNPEVSGLGSLPYLPVRAFKEFDLLSVPQEKISKILTSSGTTGQRVSRIFLDAENANRQQVALAAAMSSVLGPSRIPMLIADSKSILTDRNVLSARAAGVLGMMNFGRKHKWILDEQMSIMRQDLRAFLAQHGGGPFLIFGFTFMVWEYLLKEIRHGEFDFSNGILIHSGGWKKLEDRAVSAEEFNRTWKEKTGLVEARSFYGMVEQIGSVFIEGSDGWLYSPNYANVIVRNLEDWSICEPGQVGLIEVLSVLPTSYPGHVLLTEDLGVMSSPQEGTLWKGPRFKVIGRIPKAELRGCSDTHTHPQSG